MKPIVQKLLYKVALDHGIPLTKYEEQEGHGLIVNRMVKSKSIKVVMHTMRILVASRNNLTCAHA